jgi:hypothetical protein
MILYRRRPSPIESPRLNVGSRAADARVRYLQRDGTTREGEGGELYGAETNIADGDASA